MSAPKTWFVTGASKGLGHDLTALVLQNGDNIAATSRDADALKTAFPNYGNRFLPLKLDITSDADVCAAIQQTIDTFGRIDVVVNNAGYSLVGSIEETTDEEFRQTLDVNLFGTVNVIRHAVPHLRRQGAGHIINISSNAGYVGFANAASYNAAKFAIVGLSEALALETESFGIKVTVVAPGQFRTSFMDKGSMTYAKNRIPAYGLDDAEKMWTAYSGRQTGDPQKLVRILTEIAGADAPPLHLLLGPDTYGLIAEHRQKEAAEIEAWKYLTLSTDFD